MKVIHDVPGQRLALEGAAPRIWPAAYALALFAVCLPFVVATLWNLPNAFAADSPPGRKLAAVVLVLFWFVLLRSSARGARATARWPTGLDVDKGRGELRLRESGLFGGVARDVIVPLSEIAQLTVRRTVKAPSLHDPLRPVKDGPGVALSFRNASGRAFQLRTRVDQLDRPEEVVDLALRVGAAAGLTVFKVVRSDARDVEVELQREPEAGFEPLPAPDGPADYTRDVVADVARTVVEMETVPAFEPQSFRSEHRVRDWSPGSLVHFHKPLSLAAVGCLPFTVLVFAGPAVLLLSHRGDAVGRLVGAGFIGLIGLLIGGAAVAVVDPQTGTVSYEPLVATLRFRDDPDTPYKMMLPLATDLARSLGAARRITDE